MGLAHSSLEKHKEAVDNFKRALELEPDNESYKSNLQIAEDKLKTQVSGAAVILARVARLAFSRPKVANFCLFLTDGREIFEKLISIGLFLSLKVSKINPKFGFFKKQEFGIIQLQAPGNP